MKKDKTKINLPIGEKVWFYDEETEKIKSDYLWGVVYSQTPQNAGSGAGEIHIVEYIIGEYIHEKRIPHWLCFFTWIEVLNFIVSKCEIPLKKEKNNESNNDEH